jgi:hypothetical protein
VLRTVNCVSGSTVVGRLKACLPFWADTLKTSAFMLGIIREGYTISFVSEPPPFYAANNKSALQHPQFVAEEIEKLLIAGVMRELATAPYGCNPLTVSAGKHFV